MKISVDQISWRMFGTPSTHSTAYNTQTITNSKIKLIYTSQNLRFTIVGIHDSKNSSSASVCVFLGVSVSSLALEETSSPSARAFAGSRAKAFS